MSRWCVSLAVAVLLGVAPGCGDDDEADRDAALDLGGPRDSGPLPDRADAGRPMPDDAEPPRDMGTQAPDAGERCSSPGSSEQVECGTCGQQERFCTSTLVWEYGACEECTPRGEPCSAETRCEGGSCWLPLDGIGGSYCAAACSSAGECPDEPGFAHECTGGQCVRTCADGMGCPEGHWCDRQLGPGSCRPVAEGTCASSRDCAPGQLCSVLVDREHVYPACLARQEGVGTLGDACVAPVEPMECTTTSDCPAPLECTGFSGSRMVCAPPPGRACDFFCTAGGLCSGQCASDEDCPGTMRCSLLTFRLNDSGTNDPADDLQADLRICTYAEGSRTPCTREADCAATGPAGSAESCAWATDTEGRVSGSCVTPPAGVATPGDACGDDPATTRFEQRPCFGACTSSLCSGACSTRADCPPEAGWDCVQSPLGIGRAAPYCAFTQPCLRSADCSAGNVCRVLPLADSFGRDCEPSLGELADGASCALEPPGVLPRAERCTSGYCVDQGAQASRGSCVSLCSTNADCAATQLCSRFTVTLDNRGTRDRADDLTATLSNCVDAPGSRQRCTTSVGCTAAAEVCRPFLDATGAVSGLCTTAVEGGAPGDFCGPDSPCRDRLCLEDTLDPSAAYCSSACAGDADCTAGLVCRSIVLASWPRATTLCLRPEDPRGSPLP